MHEMVAIKAKPFEIFESIVFPVLVYMMCNQYIFFNATAKNATDGTFASF
jgi:hypothetical protein